MKTITSELLRFTAACLAAPAFAQASDRDHSLEIEGQPLFAARSGYSDEGNLQARPFGGRWATSNLIAALGDEDSDGEVATELPEPNDSLLGLQHGSSTLGRKNYRPSFVRVADPEPIGGGKNEFSPQQVGNDTQLRGSDRRQRSRDIEEIIVTAQKREQRLEDVPVSIAVVTADDIDHRGIVGAGDYLRGLPGANQSENAPAQSIVIRGLEGNTIFQGGRGGETTGTYFGETPTTGAAGQAGSSVDIKVVDVQRVEVLRGPQGTAFGSASLGGTVRIIPASPKLDQFEGEVGVGYSVTSGTGGDNYMVRGVVNIPVLRDRLAIRGVGYSFSDSGYYRNRAGSNPEFQSAVVVPRGAQAIARDEDEVGAYYSSGARLSALLQASEDLRFSLMYLTQRNETDGYGVATSGSYEQTLLRVAPEHVRRGQTLGVVDPSIDIANATVEWDVRWADLLATYSYVESGTIFVRDYVSIGFPNALPWAASALNDSQRRVNTGEVRFTTKFDGKFNFLFGVFGEKVKEVTQLGILWTGDLQTSAVRGVRNLQDFNIGSEQDQQAAFAELSWELHPDWTISVGARYFDIHRDVPYRDWARGAFDGPVITERTPVSGITAFDESGSTFRANLSYKPREDALIYAGWSQGFRPGRSGPGLSPTACDPNGDGVVDGTNVTLDSTKTVEADEVDNYELGARFSILNRRLGIDTTIYRMEWSNVPSLNVLLNPSAPACLFGYLANVGEARSEGIDLQMNLQVTDSIRVDLGGSYIRAKITDGGTDFPTGNRLPGAPKTNANLGAQYNFNIASHSAFVRADAIYIGNFYGDVQNSLVTQAGDYVKVDAMGRIAFNNLSIDLYVRNVTNEDAFTSRGAYNYGGLDADLYGYRLRPRTIGLQLGYEFK